MAPRACVYTALYGCYDVLPELPVRMASGLDFVAFVGDPALRSDTWQVRHLPAALPDDPVRSSRYAKMMPHVLLPEYEVSVYADCSVELTAPPEAMVAALLDGRSEGIACFRHPERTGIAEEARAIIELGFYDPAAVRRQLVAYLAAGYADQVPLVWAGILLRRHNRCDVARAMERWWQHLLRYSRRDQLALPFVLHAESLAVAVHDQSVRVSPWHRWPVPEERLRAPVHPPLPPLDGNAGAAGLRATVAWLEALEAAPLLAAEAARDAALVRATAAEATAEACAARADAAEAAREAALVRAAAAEETAEACAARADAAEAAVAVAEAAAEARALRADARAAAAESRETAARGDLAIMQASTMWRATAPARRLVDAIRRGG